MPRYKMVIAYDGTEFQGWQRQLDTLAPPPAPGEPPAEARTVQLALQYAVRRAILEPVQIDGASRTDSGVHANHQVACFSCAEDRRGPPDERLALAINARLPRDVVVLSCTRVRDDFNPIRDCVAKGYRYSIRTGRRRPLWDRLTTYHCWTPIDVPAMRAAGAYFVGEHDFAAFTKSRHGRATTVRRVLECAVREPEEGLVTIDISGTGFLYNMVRIMAGTLLEVGKGRRVPGDVVRALGSGLRTDSGVTLPARGLRLEWIRYRDDADL